MSALKKEEVLTPLRGVCDTKVKGEGLIDLTGPKKDRPESGNYINLSLDFIEEIIGSEAVYAEVHFSNDFEALLERGMDPEVAGYIVASADLLAKALRHLIYRGGKYGDLNK